MRRPIAALASALVIARMTPASARCLITDADADHRYGPLVTLTSLRPSDTRDARRAVVVFSTVRATIRRYRDRGTAEAAGYRLDRPLRVGPYLEVARLATAARQPSLDLRLPDTLIFTQATRQHGPRLIGAGYAEAGDALARPLDGFPMSVARWVQISWRCTAAVVQRSQTLEIFPFERAVAGHEHPPTAAPSAVPS